MTFLVGILFLTSLSVRADNPLVTHIYTADPTARVFNDTLYIYPSHDIPEYGPFKGNNDFMMEDYHVFSTTDVMNYTDHGVILHQVQLKWSTSNYDFKLQSTSGAINGGGSSKAPQYDKDGVLQDNKFDIGAYEYSNVTSSPHEVSLSDDVFICPNPEDDKIRIFCNGFMNQDGNCSINGLKGEILQSGKLK